MFQAAADMLTGRAAAPVKAEGKPVADELEAVKAQLAALQAQMDKLAK